MHVWIRDEGIELPAKSRRGEAHGVVWRLPPYNIVHNILTNPIYAGAYAFGRTTSRISVVDGRKRVHRGVNRPIDEWDVLIKDHHAAYITWDEFERNLKAIANSATGMSSSLAGRPVKASCCCLGFCAAAIAAANSMCTTAESSVAITAMARA